MSLNHLTHVQDGLDAHLNIGCDLIVSGTSATVSSTFAGSVAITGGGTVTLTPSDIVGGVFGFTNTTTVNLPTATQLNTFFANYPQQIPLYYFVFKTYVQQGTVTFNPGAGTTTYDSVATFNYPAGASRDITYALTLIGWKILH